MSKKGSQGFDATTSSGTGLGHPVFRAELLDVDAYGLTIGIRRGDHSMAVQLTLPGELWVSWVQTLPPPQAFAEFLAWLSDNCGELAVKAAKIDWEAEVEKAAEKRANYLEQGVGEE